MSRGAASGSFTALEAAGGGLAALCHVGANVVPSGENCGVFAEVAAQGNARMLIGESARGFRSVGRGEGAAAGATAGSPGPAGLRDHRAARSRGHGAARGDARRPRARSFPRALRRTSSSSASTRPAATSRRFRWRTESQIEEGRSWLWLENGVVLFKAEASAWTPHAVQIQQVWVDPEARGHGYASRGLRDLCRLLLATTPAVTLFVRTDNAPAIALYDSIGMTKALEYRTVLL